MSSTVILHNPRCSKSRQTLALLEEKGIAPQVIEYLKTPLNVDELNDVFKKLNLESVRQMMRTKEQEYKDANLADTALSGISSCLLLSFYITLDAQKAVKP